MKLQVEQAIKEAGREFLFSFVKPAADFGNMEAFPWKSHDVAVEGAFWFDGRYIAVRGTVRTVGVYACSRCLTPVTVERNEILSEVYGSEVNLPEEVASYNGEYVDLTEAVRETLILSEPMQVLCCPDCKGLCPQCGANLNEEPCSCHTEMIDPRLAVLGNLLKTKH